MKGVVIVGFLFCLLPVPGIAGFGLPWFNTRPKPIFFDESLAGATKAPVRKPVAYRRDVNDPPPPAPKSSSRNKNNKKTAPPPQVKPETAQ